MSPESEVDEIETKLNALFKRCKAHEQSAQELIDTDQDTVLSCLRNGIQSVQTMIENLKDDDTTINPGDHLSISLDYVSIVTPRVPGAYVTELELTEMSHISNQRSALTRRERCTQMSTYFTDLAKSADKQLDDIMEIQLAAMDMEGELNRLKLDLEQTTENAERTVTATHNYLERKKTENEGALRQLSTVEADLRAVEYQASENKTQRKVAKVIKFGALIATPVFPIAAIGVAAVGQIGHMVLKDRKQDLLLEKETATTLTQTIQSSLSTLSHQIRDLNSSLLTNKTLSSRCDELSQQAHQNTTKLYCRASEYQTLKEAASRFSLYSEGLRSRAELMEDFDEEEEMRNGAVRLWRDLEKCGRVGVREICGPLRELGKRGELVVLAKEEVEEGWMIEL